MKKLFLLFAMTGTLAISGCSNDDDDQSCESCSAQGETVQICDNGDGTYTLTVAGEAETVNESDLEGLTPKQIVDATCQALDLIPTP